MRGRLVLDCLPSMVLVSPVWPCWSLALLPLLFDAYELVRYLRVFNFCKIERQSFMLAVLFVQIGLHLSSANPKGDHLRPTSCSTMLTTKNPSKDVSHPA